MTNKSMFSVISKKNIIMVFCICAVSLWAQNNSYAQKKLYNMGYPINTSGDDFSPSVTEDGRILLFNSKDSKEDNQNIYICQNVNGIWTKPKYFNEINSNYDDETPFISHDGKIILFSSNRENGIYNIYISEKLNGEWTEPVKIPGDVNSGANERTPSLSKDKKFLFFTRWTSEDLSKSKIMRATLKKGKFVNSKIFPYPVNSGHYDLGLMPSRQFSGFYFASQRSKGHGSWDLYFIGYKYGKFGKAINLGLPINSEDNDMFLSDTYSNEIFLCTNRGGGYGKYDIYRTSLPEHITRNIQASIKQIKQDKRDDSLIYRPGKKKTNDSSILTRDNKKNNQQKNKDNSGKKNTGTTSSKHTKTGDTKQVDANSTKNPDSMNTKNNTDGSSKDANSDTTIDNGNKTTGKDVPKKTKLFFTIIDKDSKKPVPLRVKVFLKDDADPLVMELRSTKRVGDENGEFVVIPKQDVRYVVIKPISNYYKHFRKVFLVDWGTHKKYTIYVTKRKHAGDYYGTPEDYNVNKGSNIRRRCFTYSRKGLQLCPIYFKLNSSHIDMNYYPYLHEIINYMRKNRNAVIKVYGHADYVGRKRYNRKLSIKRARAVRWFFMKFGIESYRIRITGLGEKCPKTRNRRKKFLNRRVEFKIVK